MYLSIDLDGRWAFNDVECPRNYADDARELYRACKESSPFATGPIDQSPACVRDSGSTKEKREREEHEERTAWHSVHKGRSTRSAACARQIRS